MVNVLRLRDRLFPITPKERSARKPICKEEFRLHCLSTPMTENVASLPTFEALCEYVHQMLCEHDQLDAEQTPLLRSIIMRSNRPCGMFFQIQGPRRVKTYAVWAGEENRVLFYDSQGNRFAETRLSESPDPLKLPRAA